MEVTERFADVVRRDPVPLDEAALLIGMHAAPGRDPETSLARLDDLAGSVPQPSVETLLATLFGAEGFVGDSESYYDPRNSYLHEVLERRRGIPITLSVVAMEVGRRIGVALDGVGTPAHFMLRTREPEPRFVDAFGGGRILDRREMDVFFDALARSGARFCRWLLDELNAAAGDDDRASQLLDSVAAVAFSREPRDSKWAARPASALALRQRGTASGAPHSPTGLHCDTRRDVTQVARDTLHAADAGARGTAVRILRAMAPDGVVETLLACMDDPALAPRLDAIMALGELGGAGTVSVLAASAESAEPSEREAGRRALEHQRAREMTATIARLEVHPKELAEEDSSRLHAPFRMKGKPMWEWLASSDLRSEPARVAPPDDPRKPWNRTGRSNTTRERLQKVRGDGDPLFHISVEAAVRALPEIRPYPERELTYLIAQVVGDYSTTRRHLVMDKSQAIMRREGGVYEFTEHGQTVWRIERHIADKYLHDA
ncbi:MAG: transglutaminase family protein [Candidatus Poribacteria bacterium]